ncbi:lipid-A-disaccharide synthase [Frateuria aurantia]|uniref:Lipid-A-disaccharide synthase n=1 Tax=Frateuria aurantia (strain ATCC 33424 / DSM 6220 / KCTC 2777 / LMG 1558 / NBRC 3245 / NCIMB 13370) TaxID=767434 RepID=H8KZ80_FRAAD|nr:lipid-A-disaccharide synthase [Frateuria aurantia]AFC85184.1 lipid-A-disaccharide synthase [Frateuria aurantia DSM 6220]
MSESAPSPAPVFALIAGEASGDQLGGGLIIALRQRFPEARFVGIGGERMKAAGLESWHDMRELSLFGLVEVLGHLPRLLRLRKALLRRLLQLRPDVVIGIDAPDFNLGVERHLKQAGLRTVHYVSPSVWAWRENRAAKLGRSADEILCLFPMEPEIYARHGGHGHFVGHPLAWQFPIHVDRAPARQRLDLSSETPVLAVLPGSRQSEVQSLGRIFLQASRQIAAQIPGLEIVIPAADPAIRQTLQQLIDALPEDAPAVRLLDGQAHDALLASDVVLVASGTATLEAMLAKRPMVVGYRISPLSLWLARSLKMIRTEVYALPNILARACGLGETTLLAPELVQDDCTPGKLAAAVLALFRDSHQREAIVRGFEILHERLRGDAERSPSDQAAEVIAGMIAPPAPAETGGETSVTEPAARD